MKVSNCTVTETTEVSGCIVEDLDLEFATLFCNSIGKSLKGAAVRGKYLQVFLKLAAAFSAQSTFLFP